MHLTSILLLLQDTNAPAGTEQGAPQGAPVSPLIQFAPYILIGVVFWLLMIRPEQKNRKKRAAMLAAIGKGDKVMTNGGLYGTVVQVQDQIVTLQIAEGVRVRYALSAIQSVEQESVEKAAEAKTT
jgi:preprotein translocase subunit YajC